MGYRPIREYAAVGNDDRVALVDRAGSIDWCCFPTAAGPSVFARLLDDDHGGHFAVRPTDSFDLERRYREHTNVLETTFETRSGSVTVTDFMPVGRPDGGDPNQHAIYRHVECTEGTLTLEIDCQPRPDYARASVDVEVADSELAGTEGADATDGGRAAAESETTSETIGEATGDMEAPEEESAGGAFHFRADGEELALQLRGDLAARALDDRVVGTTRLSSGDEAWCVLQYGHAEPVTANDCEALLEETVAYWREWTDELCDVGDALLGGTWADEIVRSGLVLKLLINDGTGAIYAAPTTSLPEEYGDDRNWDYRHNWIRDAKFTVQALYNLGRDEEADRYFEWFCDVSEDDPAAMQPVYGVHDDVDLRERTLDHLSGYRYSRPVRIGNAAAEQNQHDIYGAFVQGIYETHRHDGDLTDEVWASVCDVVDHVCEVWTEPDDGIWEVRDEPRHYLHSKLLCWVAVDRAIRLAEDEDRTAPLDRWREEREAIRDAILERGYSDEVGSFVQHFDTEEAIDASALLVPVYEFLPPDDERVQSTIDTVEAELLTDEGLVYRSCDSDATPEENGAFVFCTFWLVDALVLAGRVEEAREIFTTVLEYTSPLGLLAERIDPETGELLGNYPQAFSHIGLVNSALYLANALEDQDDPEYDVGEFDDVPTPLFRTGSEE